jgi:hypothetical protein
MCVSVNALNAKKNTKNREIIRRIHLKKTAPTCSYAYAYNIIYELQKLRPYGRCSGSGRAVTANSGYHVVLDT